MEIAFDFASIFPDCPIQKLERSHLIRFTPRKFWAVQKAIDTLGELSTEAQGLKRILTSYQKVLDQEDDQHIYLMWNTHATKENVSILIGLLKVGHKKLYLLDSGGRQQFEETPLCILDFYVHETVQRQGNGHQLFDFMLSAEQTNAWGIAIDRPSEALLAFMEKYYQLSKPVWQSTNFVVFPQFFENKKTVTKINEDDVKRGARSEKASGMIQAPPTQRSGSTSRRDTASGIIHNNDVIGNTKNVDPNTPLGRKNTRDFGHQNIW